jgi:hypothetical protein
MIALVHHKTIHHRLELHEDRGEVTFSSRETASGIADIFFAASPVNS